MKKINKLEMKRNENKGIDISINDTKIETVSNFKIEKEAGDKMYLTIQIAIDEDKSTIAI